MERRALLAALGASTSLLAGCQGTSGATGTTPEPSTTTSGEAAPTRHVSISTTGSVPSDAHLSLDVMLNRERITSDATAQLTVELTNTGTERATDIADDEYCHLFNRSRGASDPRGIWLYRQRDAPDNRVAGHWTQDIDATNTRTYVSVGCSQQALAEGTSITTTYEVWDDYATEEYLPPGTYRFDTTIPLWDSANDESDPRIIKWWLELDVTNPKA